MTQVDVDWSLTISARGGNVIPAWLDLIGDWMKADTEAGAACLERGGRAEHLHVQALFKKKWMTSKAAINKLKAMLKATLCVKRGDKSGWYATCISV